MYQIQILRQGINKKYCTQCLEVQQCLSFFLTNLVIYYGQQTKPLTLFKYQSGSINRVSLNTFY